MQKTMYETSVGDKSTTLTAAYEAGTDTALMLEDASIFPSAPNTVTVRKVDESALVTIRYAGKTATTLTGVTVVESDSTAGLTETYAIGSNVFKPLHHDDVAAMQDNIRDNVTEIGMRATTEAMNTALALKSSIEHHAEHYKNGSDEVSVDASQVVSGVISYDRLPKTVKEYTVTVNTEDERRSLTDSDVQVGDTVYVSGTHRMWYVQSIADLSSDDSYILYPTNWTDISEKPSTFSPSVHRHALADVGEEGVGAASARHASRHATGAPDEVTPSSIGAAAADHNHDEDYAQISHASRHSAGGEDEVTPANIGAAAAGHTHDTRYTKIADFSAHADRHKTGGADELTASDVGAAAVGHNHDEYYPAKNHASQHLTGGADAITPEGIGAAEEDHLHTKSQISDFAHTHDSGNDLALAIDDTSIKVNANGKLYAPAGPEPSAEGVSYDNTSSGLTAVDVQGAIDEVAGAAGHQVQADWTQNDDTRVDYVKNKPLEFSPSAHAARHLVGGTDPVTPAGIGAATSGHTHTGFAAVIHAAEHGLTGGDPLSAELVGAADRIHRHTLADVGDENVGAAAADHLHTGVYSAVGHTHQGEDIEIDGVTIFVNENHQLEAQPQSTQEQADWAETDTTAVDYIKNKPTEFTPSEHASSHATGGADPLSKVDIGLGNVDNTSDADKPISSATQTALNLKANYTEIPDIPAPLQNVTVSSWTLQTTPDVAGYPYRAAITYSGISADHFASVVFSQSDALSGNFAAVCQTAINTVYIYAQSEKTITLATVVAGAAP